MMRSHRLRAAALLFAVIILSLGLWAFVIEPARLTVRRITLRIPNWRHEHQDIKIAVLSDLHVGSPFTGLEKIQQVVALTNAERPDLVVILGDYVIQGVVGGTFVAPEPIGEVLKGLSAPLGVVSVLGNHDWWYSGRRVTSALAKAGIVVLENQAYPIQFNGKPFWIVGIADLWTRMPDIDAALLQVKDDSPVILITHNPDIFPIVTQRVSLTLAGHTHGGQVNLPVLGRLLVPSKFGQRYAQGHIVEGGRHLFVSME
jgi:predicted MPP superfamily phosphohydrolase